MGASYGLALLQAVLALGVVCALAWFALRALSRSRFGHAPGGQHVRIVERIPVDARRALLLVEVDHRRLLLSLGEAGPAQYVAELSSTAAPQDVRVAAAQSLHSAPYGGRT